MNIRMQMNLVRTLDEANEEILSLKTTNAELVEKLAASQRYGNVEYRLEHTLRKERDEAESENIRLRQALERLRDCDWVISLPDRMDAVRAIAREALAEDIR